MAEVEQTSSLDLLMDPKVLQSGFGPTPDKDINMNGYLDAYTEMNKFLGELGSIFGMVISEINSKVEILRAHRQSSQGEEYRTFASMLKFEQAQASGGEPGYREGRPSGARTLLRLHRALEFVIEFMELLRSPKDGSFGGQVSDAYCSTLGKHHGFFIYLAISIALRSVSSHASIKQTLTKGKTGIDEELSKEMEKVISAMRAGYKLTQEFYQQYGYLNLS